MSHANGEVVDPRTGARLGWFEYNGTCDVCCTRIYPTREGMCDNWRADNIRGCSCGKPPVAVILYTDYGYGFHWPGSACLGCGAIVGGTRPFDDDTTDHLPARGRPAIDCQPR